LTREIYKPYYEKNNFKERFNMIGIGSLLVTVCTLIGLVIIPLINIGVVVLGVMFVRYIVKLIAKDINDTLNRIEDSSKVEVE
jgi:hypothetical protein